jgi:hypothetical protein
MVDKSSAISGSYLIPGNCWPAELNFIYECCWMRGSYLEVGTFCGKSLHCACMALAPNARVYFIDDCSDFNHFPTKRWGTDVLNATLSAISERRPDLVVKPIFLPSTTAMRQLYEDRIKVEVLYIDACHEYAECRADIENAKQLISDNGIILGHDYSSRHPGVMDAVNECFASFRVANNTRIWVGNNYSTKYND